MTTTESNRDKIHELMVTDPTIRAVMKMYETGHFPWVDCMEALVIRLGQEKASLLKVYRFNRLLASMNTDAQQP